jgi:hypothetical protein
VLQTLAERTIRRHGPLVMSFGDKCQVCRKPLGDMPGPELMDARGHTYHLACWCRSMDIRIQEQRERIAATDLRAAARKKLIADHLDSTEPA